MALALLWPRWGTLAVYLVEQKRKIASNSTRIPNETVKLFSCGLRKHDQWSRERVIFLCKHYLSTRNSIGKDAACVRNYTAMFSGSILVISALTCFTEGGSNFSISFSFPFKLLYPYSLKGMKIKPGKSYRLPTGHLPL